MSLPSLLLQFQCIQISEESVDELSRYLGRLAQEIGIERGQIPDWANNFAADLVELFYRDAFQAPISFQHHFSIEINSSGPLPDAIQVAKVEVPPTTVRLFGLARERLTWAELRASPVLEQGINNAWAEELQGMLFRVLQGQAPNPDYA